jgi:hypothetical protein
MLSERVHTLAVPRRHEVERLLSRMEHPRALHVDVEHGEIDELRLLFVGDLGDRTRQLFLPGLAADGDDLPGLDVGAEAHDELGQRSDRLRVGHGQDTSRTAVPVGGRRDSGEKDRPRAGAVPGMRASGGAAGPGAGLTRERCPLGHQKRDSEYNVRAQGARELANRFTSLPGGRGAGDARLGGRRRGRAGLTRERCPPGQ